MKLRMSKYFRMAVILMSLLMIASVFTGCSSSTSGGTSGGNTQQGDAATSDQKFVFNLAHFFPANHVLEVKVAQGWAKAIYEATDGRITIYTYPAETLLKATETYEGVVHGVADIGLSVYAYTRGRFPVLETLLLPGISFNNSEASSWAALEAIEKLNPVELQDVHHVWTWGSGPADLYTKKPIRTMEDISGLQIGATAGPRADGLSAIGATPAIRPMSEWYEALSKGVIDGGLCPMEALYGFRLGEVTADYITLTPFLYNQLFFNVMNLDSWNKLPADLQEIFTETTAKFYAATMPTLWNEINAGGYKYVKSIKNPQVTVLSEEETQRWMSYLPPIQEDYVRYLNDRELPGAEILQTMKDLADKYNSLYPDFAPYVVD